jgi:hypothetical protein
MSKGKHFNTLLNFLKNYSKVSHFILLNGEKKRMHDFWNCRCLITRDCFILSMDLIMGLSLLEEEAIPFEWKKRLKQADIVKITKRSSFVEFPIVKTIGNANQVNITTAYKIKRSFLIKMLRKK